MSAADGTLLLENFFFASNAIIISHSVMFRGLNKEYSSNKTAQEKVLWKATVIFILFSIWRAVVWSDMCSTE